MDTHYCSDDHHLHVLQVYVKKRKALLLEGVVAVDVQVSAAAGTKKLKNKIDVNRLRVTLLCLIIVGVLYLLYIFQKSSMLARLGALEMRSLWDWTISVFDDSSSYYIDFKQISIKYKMIHSLGYFVVNHTLTMGTWLKRWHRICSVKVEVTELSWKRGKGGWSIMLFDHYGAIWSIRNIHTINSSVGNRAWMKSPSFPSQADPKMMNSSPQG